MIQGWRGDKQQIQRPGQQGLQTRQSMDTGQLPGGIPVVTPDLKLCQLGGRQGQLPQGRQVGRLHHGPQAHESNLHLLSSK